MMSPDQTVMMHFESWVDLMDMCLSEECSHSARWLVMLVLRAESFDLVVEDLE